MTSQPPAATTPPPPAAGGLERHILLIEDDAEIASEVSSDLGERGYLVRHAATGPEAAAMARSGTYDLLIVDRMLPGMDGLTIVEQLRRENDATPVLVLSALGEVDERVRGLQAGGDDYLTKPFALAELGARVEALLRRPLPSRASLLQAGPLSLDLIERLAWREGRPIELLPREFKLLEYLMRRPGQLVTRSMLLEQVWKHRFIPETNLVDVHVGKLRRKIDAPGTASLIQSVRGQGFVFQAEPDEAEMRPHA